MANKWGRRIMLLDTQNDDGAYDADNDAINGGVKYSTQRYKIKKIAVTGAVNGDDIELVQCSESSLNGPSIIKLVAETGQLNKLIDFGDGLWVKGICPKTLDNSAAVYIYL